MQGWPQTFSVTLTLLSFCHSNTYSPHLQQYQTDQSLQWFILEHELKSCQFVNADQSEMPLDYEQVLLRDWWWTWHWQGNQKCHVLPTIFSSGSLRAISQWGSTDTPADIGGNVHSTMTVINVSSLKHSVILKKASVFIYAQTLWRFKTGWRVCLKIQTIISIISSSVGSAGVREWKLQPVKHQWHGEMGKWWTF